LYVYGIGGRFPEESGWATNGIRPGFRKNESAALSAEWLMAKKQHVMSFSGCQNPYVVCLLFWYGIHYKQ